MPEQRPGFCVGRDEGAGAVAIENQPAGRGHETASQDAASDVRYLPNRFPGLNVDGLEQLAGCRVAPRAAAVERLTHLPPVVVLRIDRARFFCEHVEQLR